MDKKEVIELIKEQVNGHNRDPEYDADFSKLEAAGFKVEEIDREGGEDQGSEYFAILEVSKGDEKFHVKCDGYYQSYHGTDWDCGDTYEVQKKKVEVEQWTKV